MCAHFNQSIYAYCIRCSPPINFPRFYSIKKWEDLTPMERELKGPRYKKISMKEGESDDVLKLLDDNKMQELKELALRNYTDPSKVIGNKSWKKTWAKQVIKTKNWGFNTFVVGAISNKSHYLNGQVDILLIIQNFI